MNKLPMDELYIRAFRGLYELRLESFGRVNLIVGRNNAGKSTVLEAIAAACRPVDGPAWFELAQRGAFGRVRRSPAEQLAWLFPRDGGSEINLEWKSSGFPDRWHLNGHRSQVTKWMEDKEGDGQPSLIDHFQFILAPIEMQHHPGRRQCIFDLFPGAVLPKLESTEDRTFDLVLPTDHRDENKQVVRLSGASAPALRREVVELVRIVEPLVQDITIEAVDGRTPAIHVHHERLGDSPITAHGDGLRRVFSYALSLLHCRGGGLLLIDEIETAIHSTLLGRVYRWMVEAAVRHDVQLFITTHSLEALDAMLMGSLQKNRKARTEATDGESVDRFAVPVSLYRINKVGNVNKVVRLSGEDTWDLRSNGGLEIR